MTPELVLALGAVLVSLLRELLRAWERHLRRRGELRTRDDDTC